MFETLQRAININGRGKLSYNSIEESKKRDIEVRIRERATERSSQAKMSMDTDLLILLVLQLTGFLVYLFVFTI